VETGDLEQEGTKNRRILFSGGFSIAALFPIIEYTSIKNVKDTSSDWK
jgi:hypothetical protein